MSAEHDLQQLREVIERFVPVLFRNLTENATALSALSRVGERIDAQQAEISRLESLVAKSGNRTPDVRADAEADALGEPTGWSPRFADDKHPFGVFAGDIGVCRTCGCKPCCCKEAAREKEMRDDYVDQLETLDAERYEAQLLLHGLLTASRALHETGVNNVQSGDKAALAAYYAWEKAIAAASGPVSGAGGNT